MKRTPPKKGADRRKKPRGSRSLKSKVSSKAEKGPSPSATRQNKSSACWECSKDLSGGSTRALFVEEEVGRIFCSEECITAHFTPEIERLEKQYFRSLSSNDLPASEREKLSHLRWVTLQEPDEVWREKTLNGDYRYTLISEFQPGTKSVWCVCICLFLRGEPSFLYLSFPTKNAAMANQYRRGERVQWVRQESSSGNHSKDSLLKSEAIDPAAVPGDELGDRLADSWTEEETYRAQLNQQRRPDDIPYEEYGLYQSCLDETLQTPDEVWTMEGEAAQGESEESTENAENAEASENARRFYHFIRHYPEEGSGTWFIIVAREADEEEQIEILDAFPTRDSNLVDRYRRGTQEVGQAPMSKAAARVVH